MKPPILLLAFALSNLCALAQTNIPVQAIVSIRVTTNYVVTHTIHPVNGGYSETIRRGTLVTNVIGVMEWKGIEHEMLLETKLGPSIGEWRFAPANLDLPDGTIMGASPTRIPPNMPPPLPSR